jgi:hypothetical protein
VTLPFKATLKKIVILSQKYILEQIKVSIV